MKITFRSFIFSIMIFSFCSCKKAFERHCWMVIDNIGNKVTRMCGKTENELISSSSNYLGGASLTACNYYIDEGDLLCWVSQNGMRLININEHEMNLMANCYFQGSVFQQTSCDCARWYQREKRVYKPTNTTSYSTITGRTYCGDSANAIYHQPYIRKDDADSLITIQVSSDGRSFY